MKVEDLAAKALQHTEGETQQVQEIRKLFAFYHSVNHVQAERAKLVFEAHQPLMEGPDTFEPTYRAPKGPRANMSSVTHVKLRANVDAQPAQAAEEQAAQAHATQAEVVRRARQLAAQAAHHSGLRPRATTAELGDSIRAAGLERDPDGRMSRGAAGPTCAPTSDRMWRAGGRDSGGP